MVKNIGGLFRGTGYGSEVPCIYKFNAEDFSISWLTEKVNMEIKIVNNMYAVKKKKYSRIILFKNIQIKTCLFIFVILIFGLFVHRSQNEKFVPCP